jgi:GNAT superfamily N-acetyltransferase
MAMFQYPARPHYTRNDHARNDAACENLHSHPGTIGACANPGLIQIKHRHGEIILSWEGTMPAEQLAVSSRAGTISHVWAADYSAVEHLRDGRPIEIRALRPDDRAEMLAAVGRTGKQSLQRRFFAPKKGFSEQELAFFLNIDFENHVALVAQIDEDESPTIVGGGRYIVVRPGQAEIAFVVVDTYQGQGIGTILMQHLAVLARDGGLKELMRRSYPRTP